MEYGAWNMGILGSRYEDRPKFQKLGETKEEDEEGGVKKDSKQN